VIVVQKIVLIQVVYLLLIKKFRTMIFFGSYMRPNLPCVIKDVTSTWEASSKWLNDHTINLEYLKRKYGSCDVTIYNCNDRYFNSQRTEVASLRLSWTVGVVSAPTPNT
jgi:uncharacterized protein (DUF2141 family)